MELSITVESMIRKVDPLNNRIEVDTFWFDHGNSQEDQIIWHSCTLVIKSEDINRDMRSQRCTVIIVAIAHELDGIYYQPGVDGYDLGQNSPRQ